MPRSVPRIILILAALVCAPHARASEFPLSRFESLQGGVVRDMVEDSRGFMWLATDTGLWRWDRVEFTRLRVGIPLSSSCTALLQADERTLWVGTQSGLYRVDAYTLTLMDDAPLLPDTFISGLHQDKSGHVWIATQSGLFQIECEGDVDVARPFPGLEGTSLSSMTGGADGELWLGTNGKVLHIAAGNVQARFQEQIGESRVTALEYASDGSLWVGMRNPGKIFRARGEEIRFFGEADGLCGIDVNVIGEQPGAGIWVGAEQGLARWTGAGFVLIGRRNGLLNSDVHSLLVDRENQLWIGTFGGGAYRLRSPHVEVFGVSDGLPHRMITALAASAEGEILVGTVGGLTRFDPSNPRGVAEHAQGPTQQLYVTRSGEAWITNYAGTSRLSDGFNVGLGHKTSLGEDATGGLLVGAYNGVWLHDGVQRTRLRVPDKVNGGTNVILLQDNNALDIGTEHGLARFRDGKWEILLTGHDVRSVCLDHAGRLLVGTSKGLGRVQGRRLTQFDMPVASEFVVRAMIRGNPGTVWAATDIGLLRIRGDIVERFTREDGLPTNDLRCLLVDGRRHLYVGTADGLARIEVQGLQPCDAKPHVVIDTVAAGGRILAAGWASSFDVPYAQNNLIFVTSRLGWRSLQGARFQFRLVGQDDRWSSPTEQRMRQFTELTPGQYTFQTKVVNERGIESNIAELSFTVLSPFWQQAWFVLSVASVLSTIVFVMVMGYRKCQHLLVVAEAAAKAKTKFVSRMSHEIRTPLTVILSCAESLGDARVSADKKEECVETIIRNGRHLIQVINDVLDVAKTNAGDMTVERIPCDLASLVTEVHSFAVHRATGKPVAVELQLEPSVPQHILTDPTKLRQVLMNLLDNAVKFTDKGHVRLRVSCAARDAEPKGLLRFDVIDTGTGIPPDKRHAVFDAFAQADSSITRRFGGTGLGLTIARSLAELLGGTLTLETRVGAGSTFAFALAVDIAGSGVLDPAKTYQEAIRSVNGLSGLRVLVADDCRDIRRVLEIVLEGAGVKVQSAGSGREAVELAKQGQFEVIVLDVHMPDLDGMSALRALRASGVNTPLLAITADATDETKRRCLEAGFDAFVPKPFENTDLLAHIGRLANSANGRPTGDMIQVEAVRPAAAPPDESQDMASPIHSTLSTRSPALAAAAEAFCASLATELSSLDQALNGRDLKRLGNLAHRLRGSGGINGYMCVSDVAGDLRTALGVARWDEIASRIEELRSLHARMLLGFRQVPSSETVAGSDQDAPARPAS